MMMEVIFLAIPVSVYGQGLECLTADDLYDDGSAIGPRNQFRRRGTGGGWGERED